MQFHRNAKLGLAGRHQLVLAIESGGSIRQSARTFNVSVATAHRWWKRWRDAGAGEGESRSCLFDRSSRAAHKSAAARARARAGDLRLSAADGLGGRGSSPARAGSRTRPSGRC